MTELTITFISPVVPSNATVVPTEKIFSSEKNSTLIDFNIIAGHQHAHEDQHILTNNYGKWKYHFDIKPFTITANNVIFSVKIPLLNLLLPEQTTFDFGLKPTKLYQLTAQGQNKHQQTHFILQALAPLTNITINAKNFDPEICGKINRISLIQLEQIQQLATLIAFDNSQKLINYLNFLREKMPYPSEGCLLHWTFDNLQKSTEKHLTFQPVLYFAQQITNDYGLELMPLNWAIIEK